MTVALGKFGIWQPAVLTSPANAAAIERTGFTTLWLSGVTADLSGVDDILDATTSLVVGTSIVNIWHGGADVAASSCHRLQRRFPDRFVLGLGAGHPELNPQFRTPMQAITAYLDDLDVAGVPIEARAIAALGPKMLALATERAGGVLPYAVTPAYTPPARNALGPDRFIAPEHKVVLDTDPVRARDTPRDYLESMLALRHYRTSLHRLGFSDADTAGRGSDRLVDALVAHGDAKTIAAKLDAHFEAGADHVAIQVMTRNRVTPPGFPDTVKAETYDDRMVAIYQTLAAELL